MEFRGLIRLSPERGKDGLLREVWRWKFSRHDRSGGLYASGTAQSRDHAKHWIAYHAHAVGARFEADVYEEAGEVLLYVKP